MGFAAACDSCSNPKWQNPTPAGNVLQPALRADVSRGGGVCDPASLTCKVFDPMVHPPKGRVASMPASAFLFSRSQSPDTGRYSARRCYDVTPAAKSGHRGTQAATVRPNRIYAFPLTLLFFAGADEAGHEGRLGLSGSGDSRLSMYSRTGAGTCSS